MRDVIGGFVRTGVVIGPGCVKLWWHREGGWSPWDTATRRHSIWKDGKRWAGWFFDGHTALRMQIVGLDRFDHKGLYVIACNHTSVLDIPAIVAAYPAPFAFSARQSLLRIPLVRQTLLLGGQVILDKDGDKEAAKRAILEGAQVDYGTSMVVFPEGTRTHNGRMSEFKKGAFHASIASGMPVLPTVIKGAFRILPKGPFRNYDPCVPIEVRFGHPISPEGKTAQGLCNETRAAMVALLDE